MEEIDWSGLALASVAGYPQFDWDITVESGEVLVKGWTKPDTWHQELVYDESVPTDTSLWDVAAYRVDTAVTRIAENLKRF